jgi:hypothetical protein
MVAYRNDVDALSARHDSLAHELAQKTKEVNDAARLLEEARTRAKLPVLENIRVATPCRADWNQMTGDERTRHCGDCKKNVYNLSHMTRDEAEALILEKEGKLCARYFQRHDGTILLKDCSIGIGARRKRRVIAVGAMALLGTAALFAYKRTRTDEAQVPTCSASMHETLDTRYTIMGLTEAPPPAPPKPQHDMVETLGDISPNYEVIQGGISDEPVEVPVAPDEQR